MKFFASLVFFMCIQSLHSLISMNTVWRDTKGVPISCNGGGFLKIHGRWWWYGESRKDAVGISKGVNAYSSASLNGPWKFEGQVLTSIDFGLLVGVLDEGSSIVVERPKVIYSSKTNQYVMWCHLDVSENSAVDAWANYVFRRAGVAVSTSPNGPFKPIRALRPNGLESLDINLFVDGDSAYMIRACTKNQYLGITKLSPDLTNTEGNIISVLKAKVEGPVLFRDPKTNSLFVIASGVHGWEPGRMFAFRGKGSRLQGMEWEAIDANPTLHPRSFFSQPTAVLTEYDPTTKKPFLVYVGDNWVYGPPHDGKSVMSEMNTPPAGRFTERYKAYIGKLLTWEHTRLPFASNIMLPLFFDHDKNPRIEYQPVWSAENPFGTVAVFGCVTGVASLQPDGRHTCRPRTCANLKSVVVGLPSLPDLDTMVPLSMGSPVGGGGGRPGGGGGLRGGYMPAALRNNNQQQQRPYRGRQLLSKQEEEDESDGVDDAEITKLKLQDCDDEIVLDRKKFCREADQTGCILPQISWLDILSGKQQTLGEKSEGISHGNYKWKNMGATMWAAKQKGKDPKFWKKEKTGD